MPELRKDPIVGRWVIIAPERAKRPYDFKDEEELSLESYDPFLEGNEEATPNEIIAYRTAGTEAGKPGWRVRVVPNKFPALQVEGELMKRGEGMFDVMQGIGAHEVIIECPHMETNMSRLPVDNVREVLWIYRDRLVDLKKDSRFVHGLIFKNKGLLAGASLPHSHSQLIVTPVVPIYVQEEIKGAQEFFNYRGRNIFDDLIQQEIATGSRVVLDTPRFLVVCPYASRFPFETWIIPKRSCSHYENIQRQEIQELGEVLKNLLLKMEIALDDPPFNYVIHSAPFDQKELPHYSWHIETFPRLTRTAGFEWGSGFYINPVPPEEAASFLRKIEIPAEE
ncbi:MAG: galactose-1-phosphate uridylyltransferase [Planctomycetaceae bacterium]|jgi:UDPglucose--hexose-1-phosphate uridylyltransferase|nr:galactose-1-phosphate uridylyltransferase [Planctomycetaceae bacterium]